LKLTEEQRRELVQYLTQTGNARLDLDVQFEALDVPSEAQPQGAAGGAQNVAAAAPNLGPVGPGAVLRRAVLAPATILVGVAE
jgi:hypothetical protein